MRTINQVNGKIKASPIINHYIEVSNDRYHWKNKSFTFIRGERADRLTLTGNWIYGAAMRELFRIAALPEYYDYHAAHKSATYQVEGMRTGKLFTFYLSAEIGLNGATIRVADRMYNINKLYYVRTNETWQNFDPAKYFEKHILKEYYFAPGLFRDIQLTLRCSKSEAIKWYRVANKNRDTEETDLIKAWKRLILKQRNIDIQDVEIFTVPELKRIYNSQPRYKRRVKAFKAPSIMELYDHCTSVADTDEGMIAEAYNVLNDYPKNSILI